MCVDMTAILFLKSEKFNTINFNKGIHPLFCQKKTITIPFCYFLNKKPKPNLDKNFFSKAQKNLNSPKIQPTKGSVN